MAALNGVLAPPPLPVSQWTPPWRAVQIAYFFSFLLWRQLTLSEKTFTVFGSATALQLFCNNGLSFEIELCKLNIEFRLHPRHR